MYEVIKLKFCSLRLSNYHNLIVNNFLFCFFYTEALPTVNFQDIEQGEQLFRKVEALSDDFPLMVTEFWSGWFDHWGVEHHTQSLQGKKLSIIKQGVNEQKRLEKRLEKSINENG